MSTPLAPYSVYPFSTVPPFVAAPDSPPLVVPTMPIVYSTLPNAAVPAYVAPVDSDFEPILFLSPFFSDRATIVASSEASLETPAALMQTIQPSQKYRSTSGVVTITLDFGIPIAANMLVLVATNLKQPDVIRVRGAETTDMTGAPVDSGGKSAWRSGVPIVQIIRAYSNAIRWTNHSAYRYWQIDIACNSGQAYVEIGRLMMGTSWQPTVSCDFGSGLGFQSPDAQQFTDYRYFSGESRGLPVRDGRFVFSAMDQNELLGDMLALRQLSGLARDFFVDLFPWRVTDGWEKTAMQAVFTDRSDFQPRPFWNGAVQIWNTSITAAEVAL